MSMSSITGLGGSQHYLLRDLANVEKTSSLSQSGPITPDQRQNGQANGRQLSSEASKVSLSVDALFSISKVNQANNVIPSKYEQFFPAREGYSVANLASAIENPAAQPFSQNRPFLEVAQAVRANLDIKYERMAENGQPFEKNTFEGIDKNSLFGELDRRALHAVASNEGGVFTDLEQRTAKSLMVQQQGLAMGRYSGPSRLADSYDKAVPPGMQDHAKIEKASILFLDKVSPEEKSSITWAHARAVSQSHYEMEMNDRGQIGEDFTSDNPLVRLLMEAFDNWSSRPGLTSIGNVENEDDLRKQPWFVGFEDRLDDVLARTRELYNVS
ncbi:hypothetical protein [Lentilitoribacter sp. Alg239-R112]|uniref:hypothetical protein n=1 Tax=Lentilitoribacter sp. Alg239-R112 TaxID=2305987 RepID=UPI0013A6A081|nr:hypothetical protein [Lentilitoribacter sp. Alg239-R112]